MKRIHLVIFITFFLGFFNAKAQEEGTRLLRFPAIHGDQIVFSYAGDLYTVEAEGGTARRLTSHKGYEMFPRFSPDGDKIAFTAQYDGNTEVYTVPKEGGSPERVTYTATLNRDDVADRMGPNNIVMTWTPDGENILFRSRKKSFNSFIGQLFKVPVEGGIPEQLPLPEGGFCSYSPNGDKLAYNQVFREFRTWKHYQGGMADDIWIHDFNTHETKAITDHEAQDIIPMWKDNTVYFLSDRDWKMNLFKYNMETEEVTKLTHFEKYDVKFPSIGDNYIVFENGGYIYKFNLQTEESSRVPITISNDMTYSREEIVDATDHIQNAGLSPNGERVTFSARGDIFSVPSNEGITYNLTKSSSANDRDARWSPDGKHIAYISDMDGEFEIYMQDKKGKEAPVKLTKNADTYKYSLKWSPDSKKIMWSDAEFRLKYTNVENKEVTLVDTSKYGEIRSYHWSPDGKWITYTKEGENDMSVVWIYNTKTGEKFKATEGWYDSADPNFSEDGKYLVLSSRRTFDPVYSSVEWNYAYKDMEKVYLITLQKSTPSPFSPKNDEVAVNDDAEKQEEDSEDLEVKIDRDGIQKRIIALPVQASNYSNIYGIDDKIYYQEYNSDNNQRSIKMFDLKEEKETTLGKGMRFTISPNNKKMLVRKDKNFAVIDLPSSEIQMKETVDMSNMKVRVDHKKEWKQIFNESWRQMRDFFYVENMHGLDWEKMKNRYSELLPYVNHRNDLTYVIGLMISELNVGHAYIQSGDRPEAEKIKTGLLGAELSRHESGYFRIERILEGNNWNDQEKSPLQAIGVDVNEGDYILEINGESVKEMNDLHKALVGKAGKKVEIRFNSSPELEGSHTEIIQPLGDESELYYHNWVQNNMEKVNEKTNGEVGYIHIPDMVTTGLNEFVEHFYPQLNKKGLIIDDRGNGGGNVSPMIIERLKRAVSRASMRRNVDEPSHTPSKAFRGPKVLLVDKYSASDGDLFAYSFKKNDLGPVIGTRTWGGVVGIRGSLPFIDGGSLRIPQFASYSAEKSKWIIEGYGVEPDIRVENDPYKEHQGIDQQLNKAIEVIQKKVEEEYEPLPEIPEFPDKSKDGQE
ncbi:MAG: S41 family peptidase [Bacteroidota bacterium]